MYQYMRLFRSLVICITFFLVSCGYSASVPMEKIVYQTGKEPKKILVVLIRGFGGQIDYFDKHGWISASKDQPRHVDYVAPNAHLGYYANESFIERLRQDIIKPARQEGYKEIWLVGISLGGMGSILYSYAYPEEIKRIYFFAPYLGDGEVQNEIRAAGGIDKWTVADDNTGKWQYQIWQRLKTIVEDPQKKVKLYIGYGDQDKLDGHDLLAGYLAEDHVIKIPGGHKDVIFSRLWTIMLERGLLKE